MISMVDPITIVEKILMIDNMYSLEKEFTKINPSKSLNGTYQIVNQVDSY